MGVDLTLLPFDHDSETLAFAHSVLGVERRRDLFEALSDLPNQQTVPARFSSYLSRGPEYEDSHYGVMDETAYGDPLTCVPVERLLEHREHRGVRDEPKNRAVWAYLAELPPGTRVALYWH